MSIISSLAAQALQSKVQAERTVAQDLDRRKKLLRPGISREPDAVDLSVDTTLTADAVRGEAGSGHEEARDDRQSKDQQSATAKPKHIDVQG